MAQRGQTLENPASGERITFRQTSADTGGELLAIDLELPANRRVPGGQHIHPKQEERFEVVEGRMKFKLGLKTIIAEAGDVVVVPAGKAHKFENAGDEVAKARVEVRPALRMEDLLETTVQLAKEGRTNAKGMPKPVDFILFTREFRAEVQGPFPPAWMQQALIAPLASIARRSRHANRYAPPAAELAVA
jgi:quercetin dioxygenase-like cupin family protein